MNCREFREEMYQVAFGEAERSPSFEQHLASCSECKQEFELAAFAASGIASAPPPPAPSLSTERLRTAILSESLRAKPSWLPRLSLAGAAAALALAAWFGFDQPAEDGDNRGVVAMNEEEPVRMTEPTGPIVIPEPSPEIIEPAPAAASVSAAPVRDRAPRRIRRSQSRPVVVPEVESSAVPDDLLAVVVGGAEGALDSEFIATRAGGGMDMATPSAMAAPEKGEEKPIIVIQPKGQANERSSDDVPIGG